MGEELPAALSASGSDLGKRIANRDVKRDATAHAVSVHRSHHAPDPGAITVVAPSVVQYIRDGPRPRRPRWIERWVKLIVFDVRRTPKCNSRSVRPGNLG